MAKLYFSYAAMNAGKSTILLQAAYNYRERGMEVLLLTSALYKDDEEGHISSRIGIGAGPAHIPDDGDLAAASGAAFHMAGDVLAGLARGTHLALPPIPGALGDALGALMLFVDREAQGWNRTQGQALFEALRIQTPTQEEIAQKVGVTRQAVQSRLSGTALDALQETLRVYESRIDTIRDAL